MGQLDSGSNCKLGLDSKCSYSLFISIQMYQHNLQRSKFICNRPSLESLESRPKMSIFVKICPKININMKISL